MKLYEILGVDPKASMQDIKDAYRALRSVHHPDREGGDTEKMAEINRAYEVLGDPDKRKDYDDNPELTPDQLNNKDIQKKAKMLFKDLFNLALKPESGNPIAFVASKLIEVKLKALEDIESSEAAIKKMTRILSKITCSSEENLAKELLVSIIDAAKANIVICEAALKVQEQAVKICDNYYYDEFAGEDKPKGVLGLLQNVVASKSISFGS